VQSFFFVLLKAARRLIEIGRCYGMEMNLEKTQVMRISRQPTPVTKTTGECEMF
jgi:hypothetical protein